MRRSGRLVASLLVVAVAVAPVAALAVCGDVSGDTRVTTIDALSVLRKAVGQNVGLVCDRCGDACDGNLRFLLGKWKFTTDFSTLLEDNYDLFGVDEGECLIVGQDLDDGGIVFASAAADAGHDYALIDPSETFCDFFLFDRTGPDSVEGFDVLLDADTNGCGNEISGVEHAMTGERASVAVTATARRALQEPDRKNLDAPVSLAPGTALPPELAALLDRMQRRARPVSPDSGTSPAD